MHVLQVNRAEAGEGGAASAVSGAIEARICHGPGHDSAQLARGLCGDTLHPQFSMCSL